MAIIEFKQCSNELKIIYRNADSKLVTLCVDSIFRSCLKNCADMTSWSLSQRVCKPIRDSPWYTIANWIANTTLYPWIMRVKYILNSGVNIFPNAPMESKMQILKRQLFIRVSSTPSASLTLLTLALDYRSLESVYLKPQDWHKELSASFMSFLWQYSNNQI